MELPIEVDGFEGRGLKLRTAGFFSGPKLLIDGQEVKGKRRRYMLRDNRGNTVECVLRFNGIDPVPKFEIAGRPILLARALRWYEYVWISLPIVLVFGGGALGVLCGVPAIYCSARIFRSTGGTPQKFLLTGAVSVASVLAFVVVAAVVSFLLGAL